MAAWELVHILGVSKRSLETFDVQDREGSMGTRRQGAPADLWRIPNSSFWGFPMHMSLSASEGWLGCHPFYIHVVADISMVMCISKSPATDELLLVPTESNSI
jgi:hypothetical protein